MRETVCVTGASGYLGTHVVAELLSQGYRVIASVREVASEGAQHLRQLALAHGADTLEVMRADFTVPNSLDAALAGSDFLIACAATTALGFTRDVDVPHTHQDANIIGADNMLQSVKRCTHLKKVVYSSSMAAVFRSDVGGDHLYDESDWNNDSKANSEPYFYSKTQAERLLKTQHEADTSGAFPPLVRFNPSVLMGPFTARAHQDSSISILRNLLNARASGCPRLYYSIADVRDVARIYVEALRNPAVEGRYLLPGKSISLLGIAAVVAQHFPMYKMPRRELKGAMVYALAAHNTGLTTAYLDKFLGIEHRFDDSKLKRDFCDPYRIDLVQTLIDSVTAIRTVAQPGVQSAI
ncbi:NAD-dependent epimerase/dehydratase family protein [Alkalimonas collagenimarina]|uniref:NAD-dependent epimerase/dehydratase family protein n=1 Tax=Alkalimonas collagenimarina TaxID=400390 RepID=A0ABT9H0X1_9GAMM|nr:NAD-dependent epimerase/dehydratase family protein [Alkalimonas collagenimarina]MDP4536969.1 NAD-dependent epimerase/dehydratase family protein [Alkalimonas collagenimarina]